MNQTTTTNPPPAKPGGALKEDLAMAGGAMMMDVTDAADLRRKRRRAVAEELVERAEHLLPPDRALIRAVYHDGQTAAEIARLQGVSPRRVRSRLRRLIARMASPDFLVVARDRHAWPPTRRRVATAVVLQGLSMRETAIRLRLSLHAVRRHMEQIRALVEASQTRARSPLG